MNRLFVTAAAAALFAFAPGAAKADGDTLRIAHFAFPSQFGMPYGTFGTDGAFPLYTVYDALVNVDENGETSPGLALSWEAQDQTTWILKLRPGVKFHNGKPFNAAVVAANIDALNNDPIVKTQQGTRQLRGVATGRVIDELTVEIKMAFPDPILPRRMAIFRPHEPEAWAELGADEYGRHPIGTGSYKIAEWGTNKITGSAHTEGWRPPKIANLEILNLPEPPARIQALNSGQVDIAWTVSPDARVAIESAGNKVVLSPTNNTLNLILLHQKEDSPVHDVRVRQALNYAFDKETFINTILGGTTVASGQPTTRGMGGHFDDIEPYPFDPDKAKQLLTEAGYPNGFKMTAQIVVALGEFKDTMESMALDFKKVGVDMELQVLSIPRFIKTVLGQEKWSGDAFSMMYEGYPSSDLGRIMNTHSCNFFNKHTCFTEIMPAINAMNTEFDPKKRSDLQREIAQFYHDNASAVFSHDRVQIDGIAANVRNYKLVNRVINFHEIEFAN